jgi:hypothetical protein
MRLVPSVIASHSWPRIAAALLFVTSPVWAQDDPTKPKTAPASAPGLSKAAAASIEEFMKTLPANLTPEQVAEIRRRLEAAELVRRTRTTTVKGADRGGPGAFPAADRGFPAPGWSKSARSVEMDRLGARLEAAPAIITDQLNLPATVGLVVGDVTPGSAADKAGLKPNDFLVELNGKPVPNRLVDVTTLLEAVKANTPVDAVVYRKGKKETVKGLSLPAATRPAAADLTSVSITRRGDHVTASQTEATGRVQVSIAVSDGKLKVEQVAVLDGPVTETYESVDKVPEKHRERAQKLLDAAEKLHGAAKK